MLFPYRDTCFAAALQMELPPEVKHTLIPMLWNLINAGRWTEQNAKQTQYLGDDDDGSLRRSVPMHAMGLTNASRHWMRNVAGTRLSPASRHLWQV